MSYTADDIKTLSFREGVRQRVQMYLGSADNEGAYQAFKEILNNSTDEAISGYGDSIDIVINEEKCSISVRDYGRGVPFLVKEDGTNVLVDIYTKSHTGGKFDDKSYKNVSGLNGVGGSCVCLSSKDFIVESYRDGKKAKAVFTKGVLDSYHESDTKEKNGTYVCFIPDNEVFKDEEIHYKYDELCDKIKAISYLCNGIRFNVMNYTTKKVVTYCAKNGIVDFIKDNISAPLHKTVIQKTVEDENGDKVEIAFQWGGNGEQSHVFVNGLRCPEGGSPITGAKSAITRTFNSLAKTNFNGDNIRDGLFYVINCSVSNPSFANQTKSKINNANLRTLASNAFSDALKEFSFKRKEEFEVVVELMKKIAKAEAAAERARQNILNATKDIEKNQKKKVFASEKLKDAEFLGENSMLLLAEGDSALNGLAQARDYTKYGLMALRGKIINPLSNTEEKVYQNEEIKLLLSAMNIIPGRYNSSKLRYGKIGICVDADSDK